jgi:ribosomal protein S18 acetylase RimI-like enzyme
MLNPAAITFRIAKKHDIPLIKDLATRIWREHYPGIISPEQIEYMLEKMYSHDVILGEIAEQEYRYVLALSDNEPVGFIAYVNEPAKHAVKISRLYILPSLHAKGIGRQMLDYAKKDALRIGARTISLFVNKNNAKAIMAYERFGFAKSGEVVTDIGKGFVMDDFRMELRL